MHPTPATRQASGPLSLSPDQFADDRAVAALLGLSRSYLRQLRVNGGGPKFSKLGAAVRYRVSDVLAWAEAKSATSTSDVGA